jgi:hypothetical protein
MTLFKRKWLCAVCNEPVIYDSEAKTVSCKCGTIKLQVRPLDINTNFTVLAVELVKL